MAESLIIRVDNPRRPIASYVWGTRFTTDPATATRFPSYREACRKAELASTCGHLEDSYCIVPFHA